MDETVDLQEFPLINHRLRAGLALAAVAVTTAVGEILR